jgi:hypothetical protein
MALLHLIRQLAVLVCMCLPLVITALVVAAPGVLIAVLCGLVAWGNRLAAARDPVLSAAINQAQARNEASSGVAFVSEYFRCYVSAVAITLQLAQTAFISLGQPRVCFIVYMPQLRQMSKYLSIGTFELLFRAGLANSVNPSRPWVSPMGLMWCGNQLGIGLCGLLFPALDHLSQQQLEQLPSRLQELFPGATLALAGRLPSVMAAAGIKMKAPVVDGLAGEPHHCTEL